MDRGAWWATVHGVTRVGHDLTTKGEEILIVYILLIYTHFFFKKEFKVRRKAST